MPISSNEPSEADSTPLSSETRNAADPPVHLGPQTTVEASTGTHGIEGPASTLLIPLGSTEQHGPHLPLCTDTVIAIAWSEALAAASTQPMVVAPPLPYGSSGEHQHFAGTLSIGFDALRSIIVELARSAREQYERVVFVSGHAGNAEALISARSQLCDEGHDVHVMVPVIPGSDAHAGFTETSLMLHIAPDLVRNELAAAGCTDPVADLMPLLRTGGVIAVSSNGILGDPDGATAEAGRAILADLVSSGLHQLGIAHR